MAYPRKLLGDDEHVVLDLHPHWIRLFWPVLAIPIVVGVAAFAASKAPDGSSNAPVETAILVAAVVVLVFTTLLPWLRWITTSYVITTERVVLRDGILARSGRDIPLQRLNDVGFHHSLSERLIGSGTLTIESAGERGQAVLKWVPHVEEVQSTLNRLVEEDDLRRRRQGAEG